MTRLQLIVSDLDGTLVGDEAALKRFYNWTVRNRRFVRVAYATGRSSISVRQLLVEQDLPAPDFMISSVGTELIDFETGQPLPDWDSKVGGNWSSRLIRETLSAFSELQLQSAECQSDRKVSYLLHTARPLHLLEMEIALASAGIEAELVYSGNRFLDVLPKGINKGTAARFLAKTLDIPRNQVLACGDSANDLPLFDQGFRGVIVANALRELSDSVGKTVYRSPFSFADGVLDGIAHWSRFSEPASRIESLQEASRSRWELHRDRRFRRTAAGDDL